MLRVFPSRAVFIFELIKALRICDLIHSSCEVTSFLLRFDSEVIPSSTVLIISKRSCSDSILASRIDNLVRRSVVLYSHDDNIYRVCIDILPAGFATYLSPNGKSYRTQAIPLCSNICGVAFSGHTEKASENNSFESRISNVVQSICSTILSEKGALYGW
jgi:hypothetical protein